MSPRLRVSESRLLCLGFLTPASPFLRAFFSHQLVIFFRLAFSFSHSAIQNLSPPLHHLISSPPHAVLCFSLSPHRSMSPLHRVSTSPSPVCPYLSIRFTASPFLAGSPNVITRGTFALTVMLYTGRFLCYFSY